MVYLVGIHVALIKRDDSAGHQGSRFKVQRFKGSRFKVQGSALPLAASGQSDR